MKRRLGSCTLTALLLPRVAAACPVCFGAADGAMLQGSSMGILALLIVTVAMLGAFGLFFATLAARASRQTTAVDDAPGLSRREPVQGGVGR